VTSTETKTLAFAMIGESQTEIIRPTNDATWDLFFSNSDTDNCPITSCAMYEYGGCGTDPLPASSGGIKIEMGSSAPFDITVTKDKLDGFSK
jgi:hypothetical protein